MKTDEFTKAIYDSFISPNVMDTNFESSNIVDVIANLANAQWECSKQLKYIGDALHNYVDHRRFHDE